jgi:hypothetical protein
MALCHPQNSESRASAPYENLTKPRVTTLCTGAAMRLRLIYATVLQCCPFMECGRPALFKGRHLHSKALIKSKDKEI